MIFEYQSAGMPTLNGSRGITGKAESTATQHTKGQERSAQFRDLLDRSKQDIRQADRQLEKVRENRKETGQTTDSSRRENRKAVSDGIEARSKESSPEGVITEEAKQAENQLIDSLLTLELSQMVNMQNLQGGVDPSLAGFNLKLGQEEMTIPEALSNQEAVIQLTEMNDQWEGTPVVAMLPEFNEMADVEFQVLTQNHSITENQDNAVLPGLSGIIESESVDTKDIAKNTVYQTNVAPEPVTQINRVDDSKFKVVDGIEEMNRDLVEEVKTAATASRMDLSEQTEEISSEQTKTVNVQKNPINQTENQNPDERGLQDLSLSGITANKGSEVQQSNKVAVAQQVEQKILHNFEPNKPMTLQMTLSPDNLGDIDIKLSYNQGKLIIDIMAASLETQKLLGNQINHLVRGLALQNVKVETVNLNTLVEATENGESMSSLLNDGSQFSHHQHNTPLKEHYLSKGSIQNRRFNNELEDSNDELISLAQNLQYNGQRRINYLV